MKVSNLQLFEGGCYDQDGNFQFTALPHIPDGFIFQITKDNFKFRNIIIMNIFQTISSTFRPFLPEFSLEDPFDIASREYAKSLELLFENHGMPQIKVEVSEDVRELHSQIRKDHAF